MQQATGLVLFVLLVCLRAFSFLYVLAPIRNLVGASILPVLSLGFVFPAIDLAISTHSGMLSGFSSGISIMPVSQCLVLALREMLIGAVLGVPIVLELELFPLTGRMIDALRGAQYAEQVLPGAGERGSVLEQLGAMLAVTLFFRLGWYQAPLRSLLESFEVVPITSFDWGVVVGTERAEVLPFISRSLGLLGKVFFHALAYSWPTLSFVLLMDVGAGVMSRLASRLNYVVEIVPIKTCIPLALALYALTPIALQRLLVLGSQISSPSGITAAAPSAP